MKKFLKISATVLFVSAILNFASCTKTSSFNWYEKPIDVTTGQVATSNSTQVYFGVFPKTVLPQNEEAIISKKTVKMGPNTYYKGKDGNLYARVLEKWDINIGEIDYSDNSKVKDISENSYRYFKVEPIKWKVLDVNYNDTGKALLLAEETLTGFVPYYIDKDDRIVGKTTIYANNYKYSTIRAYLNGSYEPEDTQKKTYEGTGFLQTAFTSKAQNIISATTVDNSESSTTAAGIDGTIYGSTYYACENTNDKIFLLSRNEVTKYSPELYYDCGEGNSRIRIATDYAMANGAEQHYRKDYGCDWWLRSPSGFINKFFDYLVYIVEPDGCVDHEANTQNDVGIVPALTISFSSNFKSDKDAKVDAEKSENREVNLDYIKSELETAFVQIPYRNYEVMKTEVTQKLYEAVIGKNPSSFKGSNLPVEEVSWYDCIYFCNKLSEIVGVTPVYSVNGTTDVEKWNYKPHKDAVIKDKITQNLNANGFRLPTNIEWGYAVRGGEDYIYSGGSDLDFVGWHFQNSQDKTHKVGENKPNNYGLYDMSGNVWEWCWDTGSNNVSCIRGGSYSYYDDFCEVSSKKYVDALSTDKDIGFRLTRTIFESENALDIENEFEKLFVQIPGKNYEVMKTEVTQGLYDVVIEENPDFNDGYNYKKPVNFVYWSDCIYFCNKLSEIMGLKPVYSVNGTRDMAKWNWDFDRFGDREELQGTITQNARAEGFRLLTVEEWEYAALGGDKNTYSGSENIDEVGWYKGNSGDEIHEVGQKKANGYGLYDMSGNVYEWCWDSYATYFRYFLGGSYRSSDFICDVSNIDGDPVAFARDDDRGFRIARTYKLD